MTKAPPANPAPVCTSPEDVPFLYCLRNPEVLDWKSCLSPEEIEVQARRQQDMPLEISPTLFLADHKACANLELMQARGVTHIFNVAGKGHQCSEVEYRQAGIEQVSFDEAEDDEDYPMLERHLGAFREFCEKARVEKGDAAKVVIHCRAGL